MHDSALSKFPPGLHEHPEQPPTISLPRIDPLTGELIDDVEVVRTFEHFDQLDDAWGMDLLQNRNFIEHPFLECCISIEPFQFDGFDEDQFFGEEVASLVLLPLLGRLDQRNYDKVVNELGHAPLTIIVLSAVMQQLMIVGYQPPHHYYSLLSAAVKPVVLHRFRPEGQAAELLDWLFPASLVLYDESFHQEHRLINHELLVQRADGRPSNRPNHFVLTGSSGQFSYCSSQLFYVHIHGNAGTSCCSDALLGLPQVRAVPAADLHRSDFQHSTMEASRKAYGHLSRNQD